MDLTLFFIHLLACAAPATTGAMFQPGEWYNGLQKPTWTPPRWAFPVAWTTFYLLMSAAAARVAALDGSGLALSFWSAQIAFNTLWTPVFFGLQRMRAAMIIMVVLWLTVAATTVAFFGQDFWAGLMFVPYLAWVTVAGALNLSVLRLNPAFAR